VRNVKALFKRLRVIYEKVEESFPTTSSELLEGEVEVITTVQIPKHVPLPT
jgi:hypothetical protein